MSPSGTVLIGLSQGGLIARLMVTDSGSRFWSSTAAGVPLAGLPPAPQGDAV